MSADSLMDAVICRLLVGRVPCRSCSRGGWGPLRGEVLLRSRQWRDCTIANALNLHASDGNHVVGGVVEEHFSSWNDHDIPFGVIRNASQRIFQTILQDELNCIRQALPGFSLRATLTVRSRHLGTICDVPLTVSFEDCRVCIAHRSMLPRRIRMLRMSRRSPFSNLSRAATHGSTPPSRSVTVNYAGSGKPDTVPCLPSAPTRFDCCRCDADCSCPLPNAISRFALWS